MNKNRQERINEFLKQGIDPKDIKETHDGFLLFDHYIIAAKINRWRIKGKINWITFMNIGPFVKKIINERAATKKELEEAIEEEKYCPCCGNYLEDYD